MQRINFTETTLTTLTRNARCSFANAVYKLTMKAQQGLKCDDLFKKSVLMNEVNKLLCKYKLDECISFHPYLEGGVSTWYFGIGNFAPAIITYYLKIDDNPENDVLIGSGTTLEEINIDINNNTESTGVSSVFNEETNYITITSPIGCFIKADLYGTKDPAGIIPATQVTFLASKCPQVETCVNYTEEELNCIAPQDLQLIFEFTHRYKETLAKSTKRITSPSTSSSSSSASDCCNWGSIGGSIGNQSDLVAYLNTIEKNLISVYDETTEITGDLKSLKFLGAGVTATNSGGNVSVTIPGGGGGGPTMIELTNAELLAEITAGTIVKGVIYRVMDAINGIVQVIGRGTNSINKAAYIEGKVDLTLVQKIGIYGTYDLYTNTFTEQGRIATQPTVNEDFGHGYYVGQELKTLDTGLTYVCTDNTNANAVWSLVPGGGSQDLAQVLAVNNISGPNDIQFDTLQGLLFNNSSRVREGITDAGLGGAKGVALVCSLDYELKWEAGRLYVMDQTGSFIRQSLYNFTTTPTTSDDASLGYQDGSLWTLDNGDTYVCTDAALGTWVNKGNAYIIEITSTDLAALEGAGTLSLTTIYVVTDAPYRIALKAEAVNKIGANGTIIDLTFSGSVYYDLATNTIINGTMSDIDGNTWNGCLPSATTLGGSSTKNTFYQGATSNTLGTGNYLNTFEQDAANNELGINCGANTFKQYANGFIFGGGLQNVTIEANTTGANYTAGSYSFMYSQNYPATIFTDGSVNFHRYFDIANDRIVVTNLSTLAVSYIGGGSGGDAYLANDQTFTGENTFAIGSGNDTPVTITKGGSNAALKVTKSSGSGDAIEVADGSVSIADETASTIAHFDGSKRIKSLATSTYPSLTELALVKGVTGSDIQTQINGKVTSCASGADGTASSGTTNTISISVLIPANTFALDDVIRINHRVRATGTAATRETRVYANTTNAIAGAVLVATASLGATILAANMQRFLAIKNATTNTEVITATSSQLTDYNNLTTAVSTLAINWTVDQYIIFAVNALNGGDSIRATMYSIEKL